MNRCITKPIVKGVEGVLISIFIEQVSKKIIVRSVKLLFKGRCQMSIMSSNVANLSVRKEIFYIIYIVVDKERRGLKIADRRDKIRLVIVLYVVRGCNWWVLIIMTFNHSMAFSWKVFDGVNNRHKSIDFWRQQFQLNDCQMLKNDPLRNAPLRKCHYP